MFTFGVLRAPNRPYLLATMLKSIIYALFMFLLACGSQLEPLSTIKVTETDGLNRRLDYVVAEIPAPKQFQNNSNLSAIDTENSTVVAVQVLDTLRRNNEKVWKVMFPISIEARSSKNFEIHVGDKLSKQNPTGIHLAEDGKAVENEIYKVIFSDENDQRGGQVSGIFLKNFDNQRLKRGHIPMHWAPNFSRPDSESYFGFEHLSTSSHNATSSGMYQVLKTRAGTTDSIPEITIAGKYTFLGELPYFYFESTMTMKDDVVLDLLRNDEMTMDSLFTHVIYRPKGGMVSQLKLYQPELDSLDNKPIPDNADFVGFYHKEKGYGLASIRLRYDNTNLNGMPSPTHKPYTKITRSSGHGRYWNRILTDTVLNFPEGSRYQEKNAYLIFDASTENPAKEVLYYAERLWHPLKIQVN